MPDDDFPPNDPFRPGYRLEFDSSFPGPTLDRTQWLPYYLPQWSSRSLSRARYALPGACLQLQIEAGQPPWCPQHDGAVRVSSLQTGCFAGPVGSRLGQHQFKPDLTVTEAQPTARLYTPRYGYFETRLKAVPVPGYMVSLWMIGFEEQPRQCAEICICELFGDRTTAESSQVNYGLHPFNDPRIRDAFFRDSLPINAAGYHIYAAEWTPVRVDFYVDNRLTRTIRQSPDYPMQFMLGIYELPDLLPGGAQETSWPKVFAVDYVRGNQPLAGYD